jgi:hypothetical protein
MNMTAGRPPALPRPAFPRVLVGVGIGTILEWYDFSLYSGLSGTITANFFPSYGNATATALAFW